MKNMFLNLLDGFENFRLCPCPIDIRCTWSKAQCFKPAEFLTNVFIAFLCFLICLTGIALFSLRCLCFFGPEPVSLSGICTLSSTLGSWSMTGAPRRYCSTNIIIIAWPYVAAAWQKAGRYPFWGLISHFICYSRFCGSIHSSLYIILDVVN